MRSAWLNEAVGIGNDDLERSQNVALARVAGILDDASGGPLGPPISSIPPALLRLMSGRCPALASVTSSAAASTTRQHAVANIPCRAFASAARFDRFQHARRIMLDRERVTEIAHSLAISSAADTPLPDTSPMTMAMRIASRSMKS